MRPVLLSWIIPWWAALMSSSWQLVTGSPPHPPPQPPPPPLLQASTSNSQDLEILTYHIQSVVISRYAVTTVTCRIRNPSYDPQEASFSLLLPVNAFISNLTIEAGGKNYTSLVREKEEARRTYEKARSKGQNTAIVHQKERETSRFRVDATVTEQDEIIFYLTYEELLERRLGVYSHKVNVHPGYPVRDLLVDITIHETRDITVLKVKKVPGGHRFKEAVSEWREGAKTARVQYDPDPEMMPSDGVVHGQLEIHYDVERFLGAGDVQIEDGYFAHFFAPIDLEYTPKHITFLIDTSGSMGGRKILQVKDALRHILTDLNSGDTFNIIHFSDGTDRLGTMRYTGTAVRKAKKFINSLTAEGGTNIDLGLKVSMSQNLDYVAETVRPHIIVMLTDGKPTSGVTQASTILRNVRERNKENAVIFSLGFGNAADVNLLEKISLQNRGNFRKIYEDEDAAEQLKGFYQELSTPILIDVQFSYTDDTVMMDSLSNTNFYNYFRGTELIVTGQTEAEQPTGLRANITGQGRNGAFFLGVNDWNTVPPPDHHLLDHLHLAPTPRNFLKRLWGFQRVKDLLQIKTAAKGNHERQLAEKKALKIALEHHFVTPLTSLVVVQPDQESCKDYEDDEDEDGEATSEEGHELVPPEEIDEGGNATNTVVLDTEDSVVRAFNPETIQVLNDEEDYSYFDQDFDSEFYLPEQRHRFASAMAGSVSNFQQKGTTVLISLIFSYIMKHVLEPGIHLPFK